MELPALKALTYESMLEGNVFRNIQEALPMASRCMNLRRLKLKHGPAATVDYVNMSRLAEYVTAGPTGFQSLFHLFPQIHHLELEGFKLCRFSQEMPVNVSIPPLRTITVRGKTNNQFVPDLLSRLKNGKYWDMFDMLNLEETKKGLDYAQIRTQLGVKKLVVVD